MDARDRSEWGGRSAIPVSVCFEKQLVVVAQSLCEKASGDAGGMCWSGLVYILSPCARLP